MRDEGSPLYADVVRVVAPCVVERNGEALLVVVERACNSRDFVALDRHVLDGYARVRLACGAVCGDGNVGCVAAFGCEQEVGDCCAVRAGQARNVHATLISHRVHNVKILNRECRVLAEKSFYRAARFGKVVRAVQDELCHNAFEGDICRGGGASRYANVCACSECVARFVTGNGDGCFVRGDVGRHVCRGRPRCAASGKKGRGCASRGYHFQRVFAVIEHKVRLGEVGRFARLVKHLQERSGLPVIVENEQVRKRFAVGGERSAHSEGRNVCRRGAYQFDVCFAADGLFGIDSLRGVRAGNGKALHKDK